MEDTKVLGVYSIKKNGEVRSTLFVETEFSDFQLNNEAATILGSRAEEIYVGSVDVSKLKVGDYIEVIYSKAIQTRNGIYQPVREIRIIT
jgi:hypothetical protein